MEEQHQPPKRYNYQAELPAQQPGETREEWKARTFIDRYASNGGEHQRPTPAPQPGRPHPQVIEAGENFRRQMEKLANDLNGAFDRDEVELGLPPLIRLPTRDRLDIGKKFAEAAGTTITGRTKSDHSWSLAEAASAVSDTMNLIRTKAALQEQVLQERMEAMYPVPKVEVVGLVSQAMTTHEFAERLRQAMSGDTKAFAGEQERCIKPPLGCGLPLMMTSPVQVVAGTYFRDEVSQREYGITGMCQKCQDRFEALTNEEWVAKAKEAHPDLDLVITEVAEYECGHMSCHGPCQQGERLGCEPDDGRVVRGDCADPDGTCGCGRG